MRNVLYFILLTIVGGYSLSSFASGSCYRSSAKDANAWSYNVGTITLNESQNVAGKVLVPATSFNMTGSASLWCDCPSGEDYPLYFSGVMLASKNSDGWYRINDYLATKISVDIDYYTSSGYVYLPYSDIATGDSTSGGGRYGHGNYCDNRNVIGGTPTGGVGKLDLKIERSFVGTSFIAPTIIATECVGTHAGIPCSMATAAYTYTFSGTINAPQSCTINAGTQVVVDFGSLYSGDFQTIGQKPSGFTPKTFNVPIKCNDSSAVANLTLRLQGTASTGYIDAIQSDNTDVGVVVTDSDNKILRPNDATSIIPLTLDGNNQTNVTLKAYPVSTTGSTPKEGVFTTLAYLRVDFS